MSDILMQIIGLLAVILFSTGGYYGWKWKVKGDATKAEIVRQRQTDSLRRAASAAHRATIERRVADAPDRAVAAELRRTPRRGS